MAAEPTLEPTISREKPEVREESDEGEESDVYEIEDEDEERYAYLSDEDDDDEVDEGVSEVEREKMIARLLGKQNGTTESDEEEEDDDEYHEGTAENPKPSSVTVGSKRSAGELSVGDASDDGDDDEPEGETVAKKARV